MTIRLGDEQTEDLEAIAQTEDVPVSQVVREAIKALVENRRNDAEFQERLRTSVERNRKILERPAQ
jgi:predicted transcriptional regulator